MTGSVYDSNWTKVVTLLAWTTAPLALTWLAAHHLDAIGLGDRHGPKPGPKGTI